MKVMVFADDPRSGLSYGYQGHYIAKELAREFDVYYAVPQQVTRDPIPVPGGYQLWGVGWDPSTREPLKIRDAIRRVKVDVLVTVQDIQDTGWAAGVVAEFGLAWIPYLAWDTEDASANTVKLLKSALRGSTHVVLASKFAHEIFSEAGFECSQIYNSVDTRAFRPVKVSTKPAWARGRELLLFVGRPMWRKKVEVLLGVVRELVDRGRDDVLLYLHSSVTDPSASCNIPVLVHALGIHKNVSWAGNLEWNRPFPQSVLPPLYSMADLYVTTHCGEGMGLPIVEAMACGTPFVATDYTTTAEFSGGKKRGFGVPASSVTIERGFERPLVGVGRFADAVEQLLDDDERRAEMGEAGREWVVGNCDPGVTGGQWRGLLRMFDCRKLRDERTIVWEVAQ